MRIRTIKPEFWESESLGSVSREARLLFVGLFSCCDDFGRTRASARLLASRLFPYDADAIRLVPKWLEELKEKGCVRVYKIEGETFLDIPKWENHQKIDKPSKSKIPEFPEDSRGFETAREDSEEFARVREGSRGFEKNSLGTGNREMEQGTGNREQGGVENSPPPVASENEWHLEQGVSIPEPLRTPQCVQSAREWLEYKKESKSRYKAVGLRNAVAVWAKEFTAETFPAAVQRSIASGWKGIYAGTRQHGDGHSGSDSLRDAALRNPRNQGIAGFDQWHANFQNRASNAEHNPFALDEQVPPVAKESPDAGRSGAPADGEAGPNS
jgi:hypothetical protein